MFQDFSENFGPYLITTDKNLMQPKAIHQWLSEESYWAKNIPFEVVQKSFEHSFCIGVLFEGKQIGYARFITDYATFAYLADVYVAAAHRSHGLSKRMMTILMNFDWVKNLRRVMLATLDAHGVYEPFGFVKPLMPERFMEIVRPAIYNKNDN